MLRLVLEHAGLFPYFHDAWIRDHMDCKIFNVYIYMFSFCIHVFIYIYIYIKYMCSLFAYMCVHMGALVSWSYPEDFCRVSTEFDSKELLHAQVSHA